MANTYAGPEPLRPVTASICASGTRTEIPTLRKRVSATSRSVSLAWLPATIAVAPAPTSAGVFGMVRMTREPGGTAPSIMRVEIPAAIDTRSVSETMAVAMLGST
jgi:hypothetical protein